jgi:hypothetical protein
MRWTLRLRSCRLCKARLGRDESEDAMCMLAEKVTIYSCADSGTRFMASTGQRQVQRVAACQPRHRGNGKNYQRQLLVCEHMQLGKY